MTIAVIAVYLALVLAIGVFSQRFLRRTGEDYFVATRTIGPFILLMSLFGTHMTAFSLLGASVIPGRPLSASLRLEVRP